MQPLLQVCCNFSTWLAFRFLETRVSQPLGGSVERSNTWFPLFLLRIYRETRWRPPDNLSPFCFFLTPWLLWNPHMLENEFSVKFSIAVEISQCLPPKPWGIWCYLPTKNQLWRLVLKWKSLELFSIAKDETFNIFLFSLGAVKMRKQGHVQWKQKTQQNILTSMRWNLFGFFRSAQWRLVGSSTMTELLHAHTVQIITNAERLELLVVQHISLTAI